MKKKQYIKYIGALALAISAFGVFALPVSQKEAVQAATLSGVVFEDKFADNALSNIWLKNDFSLDENSYYSMRYDNQRDYGSAMLYRDYQIHDDCVISFDFYQSEVVPEKKKDNWVGILFGYNEASAHFTNGNAAILCYGRGQTQLMDDGDGTSEKLVDTSYNDHTKYANSFNAAEDVLYTVELVVSYTGQRYTDGENLYQIDGYYYEKTGERSMSPKFSYKGIAAEGYFGFSAMSSSVMDISNIQIFEDGERVVYENFKAENGEGKKIIPSTENSSWKGVNCSETKLYTYFNGRMDISDKKEGVLLSDYYLSIDSLNEKIFHVTYDAEIKTLSESSAFGIALGLNDKAVSAKEGSFIGLQGLAGDMFAFVHIVNGEMVAQTSAIPQRLYGEGEFPISFTGYYDGRMEIKVGGYTASFDNAVKGGYVAVATLGENACEAYFDDFTIGRSAYVSSIAPNSAINFTGLKKVLEDDFVYTERYIDERVWFVGSNVGFPKVYREEANYIQFTNSNERSFFGAKQTYSEFICRFSVTITQDRANAMGASIGLSFGKANRNDAVKNSPSIMFGMTAEGMILQGYNLTLSGADANGIVKQYESYPELDFWSEENWKTSPATYRVMLIARGGKAYLYYANEADMSEMNVCKAVLTDVETSGYVTVSALGDAGFRLNDFSVTNIANNAKAETLSVGANEIDCEYVNVTFADKALYSVTGESMAFGKGISLGYNTQIKINEKFTDFLSYIDVNSVAGNGIVVQVGEKSIRLNADGTIYSDLKKIDGSGSFDFSALKNGGVIMVEAIGTKLSIGVVGAGQPTDLLEMPVAVFETENRTQPTEISVVTVNETVLSLESVRLYSLKPTIAIEADDWDASDTELPEKNPPSDMQSGGNGCAGVVSYGTTLSILGLALTFIYKKKEA